MLIKKIFYKFTNKKKYHKYKLDSSIENKIKIFKSKLEDKISKIHQIIQNQEEISFLHSGHLGDVINSLPIIKELSKKHTCNFYIQVNKPLPDDIKFYYNPKDLVFLNEKNLDMLIPLLKSQPYINKVVKFENHKIDIDLNLFREMPINFNLDSVRWYFQLTGVHADLLNPYLFVESNNVIKNKVIIIRNTRRKNYFVNYKFLKKYDNLLFIGLDHEYEDLKQEVPNLNFYDCKDFLEMAQIIKSSKFFLGNLSFGFTIAEGLKVPRLLEAFPDFPCVYPNGNNAYDFYFQKHLEKWFDHLYNIKN